MMKLKLFLKNSARHAALNILIISFLIGGCSSSITPTYLKENIAQDIQDICRKEYQLDVKAKLMGQTLWLYLPIEDIFIKSDKPEKYLERFKIEHNKEEFQGKLLKLEYLIKAVPEKEKYQEYKFNKTASEKINNVWKVLRRVIFSMERLKEGEPKFFCLVIADIKNGLEIKEIFYYLDIKKVSYEFISIGEYQHRAIQDSNISADIIGDKEGNHLRYGELTLEDFIAKQIDHRIKLKFQKPEVDTNVDIDKEIIKIVVHTIKTYELRDFTAVELNNLMNNSKIILNQGAVLTNPD
ncbi:MAG: hypothetical protein NTW64_03280 [Candidatus Omnitrophica bacterium]|nr:hypothetical protein [Candidatus Omnitrophota bacterium]